MVTIGIWESGTGLSAFLARHLPPALREQVELCPAGCLPPGEQADLLVVSPDLRREADSPPLRCRALLTPGRLSPLAGGLTAGWAVSYGLGPKDSLTVSSLGQERMGLVLQREVVTLGGACLDCQEFFLPCRAPCAPCYVLACAGVQLLLGVPPEQVAVGGYRGPEGPLAQGT